MKHYYLSFFIATLMSMACNMASAHDIAVANSDGKIIYYNYNSDGSSVSVTYRGTSYSSYSDEYYGNVVIPETVTYASMTYRVTSIESCAFLGCSGLTSMTIPNSVTSIGSHAFEYCSGLKNITIPNNVTSISYSAFYGCSGLTSVTIPNSVTSIGKEAFYGCSGLTSVTIPNSVTSISYSAFYGTAWYNNQPDGLVYAGNVAYRYKGTMPNNTSVVLKEGTTVIGSSAFSGCSGLTSITIPNSVTSIGAEAFSSCTGLTSMIVDSDNPKYDSRENCNAIIETNTNSLVYGCKSTVIPNGVTSISWGAFRRNTSLTTINIPNSVNYVGHEVFQGCEGLTSVTFGNRMIDISNSAFEWCTSLTSVTIMQETPPSFHPFPNESNVTLYVPYGCKSKYEEADYWKDFKEIVEMALSGDVNHDGSITMADANMVVNYILATDKPEDFNVEAADVNGDGDITMADANQIVNIFLGSKE